MDQGIAAAFGEMKESLLAESPMVDPVFPQAGPEPLLQKVRQAVVPEEGGRRSQAAQGADLGERQNPSLDRMDAAGERVAPQLGAQGRASGDHHPDRSVVDQGLQLPVPALDVLDLVEKQVGGLAVAGQAVEALRRNAAFEPVRNAQDRFRQPAQGLEVVELDAKDPPRVHPLVEQVLDHLELRRGLADLARSPDDDDRSDPGIEAPAHLPHQVPAGRRLRRHGLSFPPGVEAQQVVAESGWEAGVGEEGGLLVHDFSSQGPGGRWCSGGRTSGTGCSPGQWFLRFIPGGGYWRIQEGNLDNHTNVGYTTDDGGRNAVPAQAARMVPDRKRHPGIQGARGAPEHRGHRVGVRPRGGGEHRHSRRPQRRPVVRPVPRHEAILGPLRALWGPWVRLRTAKGFVNKPGYPEGSLHADGPYIQSAPVRMNAPYQDFIAKVTAVWMLTPFTRENGATVLVPGSHRADNNRTGGLEQPVPHPGQIQVTGAAGSVVLFDARTWHGSGSNNSDQDRVGLVMAYFPWWLAQDPAMPPGTPERERLLEETGLSDEELGKGTAPAAGGGVRGAARGCEAAVAALGAAVNRESIARLALNRDGLPRKLWASLQGQFDFTNFAILQQLFCDAEVFPNGGFNVDQGLCFCFSLRPTTWQARYGHTVTFIRMVESNFVLH